MFEKIKDAALSAKGKIEYWAPVSKVTGQFVSYSEAVNNAKDVVWKWVSRNSPG